jgi:transposase-like protein
MNAPRTLQQAIQHFSDFDHCKTFMMAIRWPDGKVKCPQCGSENVAWLENARVWKCYHRKHAQQKFSLKTRTIFEDSPLGLDKWLPVMWMLVNCKNGVSSWEIHRSVGVTQKTAWFMLQRGRLAMQDLSANKLDGEVEVDETFIGGKARNMHAAKRARKIQGPGGDGKEIVFGMVERGGKVITGHVDSRKKKDLQPIIRERIEAGAAIFSDDLKSYDGLENDFQHAVINHAVEYVNGNVHTNTMENFWSLLKRGLHGTYVSVEPFHLFRYLDEQAFRYNNRGMNDELRFRYVMRQIVRRRLTYKALTRKLEDGPRQEAF